MSLYKYMSGEGAIRLFRSGMVRFTQPIEFNDPFEMQPFIKGLADEPTLENQFRDGFGKTLDPQIDEMLSKLRLTAEQKSKIDRGSIHQTVQSQAPEALGLFKKLAQLVTPLVDRQIYKTVNENLGAFCLTEKPDDLLMWAHYADHHRGAILEFDQNNEFFNRRLGPQDDFRHFKKVTYTQDRPNVFLADSDAVDFFYFKSTEWEYEQEWRLIAPLADCKRVDRQNRLPIYLFKLPPECVRSVGIGVRMLDQQKLKLTRELRRADFRHVRVEQVDLDQRVFALHRRAIEPDKLDHWLTLQR